MRASRIILTQQTQIASDVAVLRADVTRALTHLEVIDGRNKIADTDHVDYETRLRLLERFRYTLAGFAIIGGLLSGFLGYFIAHLIK